MKNKYTLIAIVLAVAIGGFLVGRRLVLDQERQKNSFLAQSNAEVFIRPHAFKIGPDDAKVHLVEFMDPECESCRRLHYEVKNLLNVYGDKLQVIIRYAPFHPNSKMAIKILEAARLQGKYLETLEVLFKYQPVWGDHHNPRPDLIWSYLNEVEGLDIEKVRSDMVLAKINQIIFQDVEDTTTLEVRMTPTFFVNGKPLPKFGVSYLRDLIQQEMMK